MFGSNDDKKTPAAAGEKKSLFGWLRKKPQEPVVEQPQPLPEPTPAPVALPIAEPVLQSAAEPAPETVVVAPLPLTPAAEPWLTLPVAEEPVALVEDEQAAHITPPIPAPTAFAPEPVRAPVVEPIVEPVFVAEPALVAPEPVAPAFVAPAPVAPIVQAPAPAPVIAPVATTPIAPVETPVEPVRTEETKAGFFARLKQGLSKTSASIGEGMASLFLGKKIIDDELLEDIETRLLTADVGVEATSVIIQRLTQKVARKELADADALYKSLQAELAAMLKPVEQQIGRAHV